METTERPVVMAKRLVFVEDRTCDVAWLCSTAFGTYEVRAGLSGWEWFLHSDGNRMLYIATGKTDSSESCEDACQRDFDARWLSITEVPELVFKPDELDNGAEILTSGKYVVSRTGTAFDKWEAQYEYWVLEADLASEELAIASCNTHNRRLVLGTTEITK